MVNRMKMESQIQLINMDEIIPNRFQPRLVFSEEGLDELAQSIKEHGIIQPLVLRRVGNKFEIIAGERRFKAAELAGLTAVPAIITDLDDNESAEVAIIENTHRRNLSAIEEAKSYKKLLDRKYVTQDQLAKRLGTSQSTLANKIRLLSLDPQVQDALMKEKISERHARSLLKVTDKLKQVELLNRIINERWTVKRLDDEIQEILMSYQKNSNVTGGINANSQIDVNVNNIINNSNDIEPVKEEEANYSYTSDFSNKNNVKKSLFFNNLENETVNMNPDPSMIINPFRNESLTNPLLEDLDVIDIDEEEEQPEEVKKEEAPVVTYHEPVVDTSEEIESELKKIIGLANKRKQKVKFEEFDFGDIYQIVIKVDKNDKQ